MSNAHPHRLQKALPLLGVALFFVAILVIARQVRHFHWADVESALERISGLRLALAFFLTGLSYALLTCYDAMGVRYLGRDLDYPRIALASFCGFVFNMNIGVSVVGGSAVRYRLYSAWGFDALDVGKIVAFCALTTGVGMTTMLGGVFFFGDAPVELASWLSAIGYQPVGFALLCLVGAYLVACLFLRKPLRVRGAEFSLPTFSTGIAQILLSTLDLTVAGAVIFVLFPGVGIPFPTFVGVYLIAVGIGWVSHVPGGLGVFEAIFLKGIPGDDNQSAVLATLLVFRAVYYLVPFAIAAASLGLYETWARRHGLRVTPPPAAEG